MLTEKEIRSLKPKDRFYIVADTGGLSLRVNPSGLKAWILRVRFTDAVGKKHDSSETIGTWPEMNLFEAREKLMEIKMQAKHEKEAAILNRCPSFRQLAEEYLETVLFPKVTPKHAQKVSSRLIRIVYPHIGELKAKDITAPAVLTIIRGVEAQGNYDTAHDILQNIGQILRYGISCGTVDHDVTADLKGALRPVIRRHQSTLTRIEDITGLLRAIQTLPTGSVKRLIMFNAYTFVRPSEARLATWREINLSAREWRIPAERMKMRRPHVVYLSDQVMEILKEAQTEYANPSPYIFPALRNRDRPLSDMACTAALRRIGFSGEEMSMHGFRSMASTILYERGWDGTAIERQLAHVDKNTVRSAYNYAEHLPLRKTMLQWYADFLDALRDGKTLPQI